MGKQRKEFDGNFTREINQRANAIYEELKKENKTRNQSIDNLNINLENEVPRLRDLIGDEDDERQDGDNKSLSKLNQELGNVLTEGQNERRTREENEQALFEI